MEYRNISHNKTKLLCLNNINISAMSDSNEANLSRILILFLLNRRNAYINANAKIAAPIRNNKKTSYPSIARVTSSIEYYTAIFPLLVADTTINLFIR